VTLGFTNHELADVRLLTSFGRVARLGSISRAAAELGYVPSAISQHVTALEQRLGGTLLFTRKPGSRLVLTAEGRALAEAADELLCATAVFVDVARRVSNREGVVLRIGAFGSALSFLLPQVLLEGRTNGDEQAVETVEIEPADGVPLIDSGELDVLIAHRYLPEHHPPSGENTHLRILGSEELLPVAARSDRVIRLQDCIDAEWVAGSPRDVDRQALSRWAGNAGFDPLVRHQTRDYNTAVEMISAGLAVGLLPASVVSAPQNRPRLSVVALPDGLASPRRDILTITRSGFEMSTAVSLLDRLGETLSRRAT
jgi:DNA-binding transcriptional LysR family regulator